jgi:glycosyltransferase involved in cell wall biosynthesis
LGEAACRRLGLIAIPPEFKLSVVVPVYNEHNTIEEILRRIRAVPIPKEIILVDDYSSDGTRDVLHRIEREEAEKAAGASRRAESEERPESRVENREPDSARVHVVLDASAVPPPNSSTVQRSNRSTVQPLNTLRIFYHERNHGKGAALRTGFRHVTGDIVIVQDADLEYDPGEYPELIAPILDGRADVVFGSRFIGETHRVLLFWHYLGNKAVTTLSNMFTGLNLTDMETCYKIFRREVIDAIAPTLKSNRFGFEPEITAKVAKRRLRVYELPISYSGRDYSEGKKITWRDGLLAFWYVVRFRFGD